MKTQKEMTIQALVQQVTLQISQAFSPSITDIQKVGDVVSLYIFRFHQCLQAINSLLRREYIELVEGTRHTLAYIV